MYSGLFVVVDSNLIVSGTVNICNNSGSSGGELTIYHANNHTSYAGDQIYVSSTDFCYIMDSPYFIIFQITKQI